jgi:hypothetical protein
VRLRISDGSRELERLNFEVRLQEFIFKSVSRLSVTILDPPIATLVANFQSRVLIPTRHIVSARSPVLGGPIRPFFADLAAHRRGRPD